MKMREELEQKIHEFAELMYKLGYGNGRASSDEYGKGYDDGIDVGYLNGLNDAWECAKKIVLERKDDYTVADTISIFNCNKRDVLLHFSASEAIAKIQEYEEKQKKDCETCKQRFCSACKDGDCYEQEEDNFCSDFECAYNFKGECKNVDKCDDFKPVTKNKTPQQQIVKSCKNCKYHVTDFSNPNFPCRGRNCINLSAWESNVAEKLYSNEEKQTDKVLKQEPCEDAISRETVLKMQYRIDDSDTLATRDVVNVEDIEELPSVQPKVKTGHWILGGYDEHYYICDRCKFSASEYYSKPKFHYCPNCGAKME